MLIKITKGWEIPDREATPEPEYLDRRRFLQTAGLAGASILAGAAALSTCSTGGVAPAVATPSEPASGAARRPPGPSPYASFFPAKRNPAFILDRPLTAETVAASYNNFYEFGEDKRSPSLLAGRLTTYPWRVEVTGLVARPKAYDVEELMRLLPGEERLYRHRCVEAWAMAVPWTGFPVKSLLDLVQPLSSAGFVRMLSFYRPDEAPGQKTLHWYPWPYYEGLTLAEAMNPLAFFATGIYGHPLPPQHGAPLRLVTPWKYGFKSIKSIVKIELVSQKPHTFWNDVVPDEYDFFANVNPAVPHKRWSQAAETMIDTRERRPTLPFNGYGEFVARLYT